MKLRNAGMPINGKAEGAMKWLEGVRAAIRACGSCPLCCDLSNVDRLARPGLAGQAPRHCSMGMR